MDALYESMKRTNESELSSSRLRIYAETGSTRKNISIPETLWVIDNKADNNFISETNTDTKINQTTETNTNSTAEDFDDEIPF